MADSILIIGAGMGGLAAGVYAQMNGYDTQIIEAHTQPGGQCASWTRQGYTFDACVHHFMGSRPGSRINRLWQELGAMPRDMVKHEELVAVADEQGQIFYDYVDLDRLRDHMLDLAPEDAVEIENYINGIRSFVGRDLLGSAVLGGLPGMLGVLPPVLRNMRYMGMSLEQYATRFQNPLLRRALPLVEYSTPVIPAGVHFAKHAAATWGDILWPVGASRGLAASIAEKYKNVGGTLCLGQQVEKILVKDGRAVGVRLADGSETFADTVISNADGRKTIYELLDGRFTCDEIDRWSQFGEDDKTNWGTMVYLGVNRDLSREPSSLVLLLEEPVPLTGVTAQSLEMQIYGCDPSMAPQGKGVIKAEMVTGYAYWNDCTPQEYEQKKREAAEQVIGILEKRFPGISGQVEAVDVVTLKTWERFMGGTRGFANGPNKPFGMGTLLRPAKPTLPGLDRFYMAGVWVSGTGALFANAYSGKRAIQMICKRDGRKFLVK